MNQHFILVTLSTLIIISYLLGIISRKTKIPSVLLLIIAGILSKHLLLKIGLTITISTTSIQVIGTLGLILIVLEGALDLNIRNEQLPLVAKSLLFSVLTIAVLSTAIGITISKFYNQEIFTSIIKAVPLSIVSSAIVIPSVNSLNKSSREFLVYNSIFSDIFGVLIFNFLVMIDKAKYTYIIGFLTSVVLTLALSVLFSIILMLMLSNFRQGNEIIFILASVILLYSIGKLFHVSSLILVFTFGLMISNFYGINRKFDLVTSNLSNIPQILSEFRIITSQLSFIVRTMFFFTFGFSIKLRYLLNNKVLIFGVVVLLLVYLVRYMLLGLLSNNVTVSEVLIAPRGLITILLSYTIPPQYIISSFNEGNLLFLIIMTNLIMVIGFLADISEDKNKKTVSRYHY